MNRRDCLRTFVALAVAGQMPVEAVPHTALEPNQYMYPVGDWFLISSDTGYLEATHPTFTLCGWICSSE